MCVLTTSTKGAFQLHWKQLPAEGTFILKHCLASGDCVCVRQSSKLVVPPPGTFWKSLLSLDPDIRVSPASAVRQTLPTKGQC